jgi:hypothetical protein
MELVQMRVTLIVDSYEADLWNNVRDALKRSGLNCVKVEHEKTVDLDRVITKG